MYIVYIEYIDWFLIDLNWFKSVLLFFPFLLIYEKDRRVALTTQSAVKATWHIGNCCNSMRATATMLSCQLGLNTGAAGLKSLKGSPTVLMIRCGLKD